MQRTICSLVWDMREVNLGGNSMAFIAFEGIDGAGKTTLIDGFSRHLASLKKTFILTREPGGTPLAERIRSLFIEMSAESVAPRCEALLLQASRAQHVENVIRPALSEKKWVLCDRFSLSSLAFQSGGRGLPIAEIQWLNEFSTGHLAPDLNVIIDLEPKAALERQRDRKKDRIENEDTEFHQRVREFYVEYAEENPQKCLLLQGTDDPQSCLEKILADARIRTWLS